MSDRRKFYVKYLEKGKYLVNETLRIMHLIEINLEFVMKVFISRRNNAMIENNKRLLQCNCSLIAHYSISAVILEKCLVHDTSIRND